MESRNSAQPVGRTAGRRLSSSCPRATRPPRLPRLPARLSSAGKGPDSEERRFRSAVKGGERPRQHTGDAPAVRRERRAPGRRGRKLLLTSERLRPG